MRAKGWVRPTLVTLHWPEHGKSMARELGFTDDSCHVNNDLKRVGEHVFSQVGSILQCVLVIPFRSKP